ncbi:hypothetical protein [Microbacterium pumilum]
MGDVAAFDALCDAANFLIALIASSGREGDAGASTQAQIAEIRETVFAVDGHDRAAVKQMTADLLQRARETARG